MAVKNDLINLSDYWRGRLLRISRKLLRRHRNIQTIILGRKSDVRGETERGCEFHNFQFFVFLDEERDVVTGEIRDHSVHFAADSVIVSEKYTVYEPGMGYENMSVERHGRVSEHECVCETERVRRCDC